MALDKPMVMVALISRQTIVLGKLRNQFNLVKYYHKYRKRMDETFTCVFDQVEHKFAALLIAVRHFEAVGEDDTVHGQLFAFEKARVAICTIG